MDAFMKNLAEAINQPDLEFSPKDELASLPNWDSLAILTTLSMLDQKYGILLSGPEIQSCKTIGELYEQTVKGRSSVK